MLRKGLIFLFAFVYLLLNLGLVANIHYCGSKITQVGLLHANEANCECVAMRKMDCCHDTSVNVSLETDSSILSSLEFKSLIVSVLPQNLVYYLSNPIYPTLSLSNDLTKQLRPPIPLWIIETSVLRI